MRLFVLILTILFLAMCMILLVMSLTGTQYSEPFKEYKFVIVILNLMAGGFTRQAFKWFKNQ